MHQESTTFVKLLLLSTALDKKAFPMRESLCLSDGKTQSPPKDGEVLDNHYSGYALHALHLSGNNNHTRLEVLSPGYRLGT